MNDLDAASRPAQLIDLGGRRLALTCGGRGMPTVLLETGLGAESTDWAEVQRGVERVAQVCRYDRAGRGASDPAPGPRDGLALVEELRVLLRIAAIPGPYVLVGHSFGGLLMRLFAHRHGGEVVGLVLVDSMHEDQFDIFGPAFPPATERDPPALSEMRGFWTGGWRDPDSTRERIDLVASIAQGHAIGSLGAIPLHVIAAGTFVNNSLVPPARRASLQGQWETLQRRLLALSSRATFSMTPRSGHFVQRDDPRIVIDAIAAMVAGARRTAADPG